VLIGVLYGKFPCRPSAIKLQPSELGFLVGFVAEKVLVSKRTLNQFQSVLSLFQIQAQK